MQIRLHEYQPTWPASFEAIRADLASDLALAHITYTAIHHIGSTAIPTLLAKPIIDILITIPAPAFASPTTLPRFRDALMHGTAQGGYYYLGNGGVQGRWSFKLRPCDPWVERVERNVYVAVEGGLVERNYLALRDTLRVEEGLREEYARVKVEAVAGGGEYGNVMQYATKKNGIVRKILRRAGWGEEEIDEKEKGAVTDWPRRVEI